jgi:hypothetical protein
MRRMKFDDALFNWLQMEIVAAGRPDDRAAGETRDFFLQILTEDHGVTEVGIAETDEDFITVAYVRDGRPGRWRAPRQAAEQLLIDINANPKYNEQ